MATFELRAHFATSKLNVLFVKNLNELEKNFYLFIYLFSSLGLKVKIHLNLLPTPNN